MPGTLILLRHGESALSAAGRFTGLIDAPLTPTGVRQAVAAGAALRQGGIVPDAVLTSTLVRARHTAELVTDVLGIDAVTHELWQLNERDLGSLTGRARAEVRREVGPERYLALRRSLDGRPPTMPFRQWLALRTSPALRGSALPCAARTEALTDVVRRVRPVLAQRILPALERGGTVLVVAHGESLRALGVHLDHLTGSEVEALDFVPGRPLRYRREEGGVLHPRGGERLLLPIGTPASTPGQDR